MRSKALFFFSVAGKDVLNKVINDRYLNKYIHNNLQICLGG